MSRDNFLNPWARDDVPEIFKSICSYCGVGCGIEVLKHREGVGIGWITRR